MPAPCGPFDPALRLPPAPPHSPQAPPQCPRTFADYSTGASVVASRARTPIAAAPATATAMAPGLAGRAKPATAPLNQQYPWTPINLERLESALAKHPGRLFVSSLMHDMRYGAEIGYSGDRSHFVAHNLISSRNNPKAVSDYLMHECASGRLAGPYHDLPHPDVRCSGVGVLPRKSGKLRLIMHLSAPEGRSINDRISCKDYSLHYVTIDHAVNLMHKYGRGALLAKVDLKNAFRLCPVSPSDWPLLGIYWDNAFYVDKFLPFGLRSSPYVFNRLADALCWVASQKFGVNDIMHYLDDYLTVQPAYPPLLARQQFHALLAVMEHLHVPLAEGPDKICPPSQQITFLGIELDSQTWEMRLPATKLQELKVALEAWVTRSRCTKRELLSLAGSLSFAAKVVPPGRTFCRRLFDAASSFPSLDIPQALSQEACDDISWWHACIESWNGRSLLLEPTWKKPADIQLYTDVSDLGFGLVCGVDWAFGRWEAKQKSLSIEWRELFPIALVCVTLGERMAKRMCWCIVTTKLYVPYGAPGHPSLPQSCLLSELPYLRHPKVILCFI